MTDLTDGLGSQNYNEETLRKVLRVVMVVWVVLFLVYLLPVLFANFFPVAFSILSINLFVSHFYVDFLYWALIPFGIIAILWAAQALKASSRIIVLCAGAMMVVTALWYILYQNWVCIIMAAAYGGPFPLSIQILIAFLHILLMTLWALLFAGGLLLRKEERGVGRWIAGVTALLSWAYAIIFIFISHRSYDSMFLALLLVAISTLCIAISLKRPEPAAELPSS
ncbi:MAG: hypothetical protein FWF45_03555 [Coriobacteriia bacterium]|nr:hypothetical protein [Coriobacteriia bacterium]